MTSKILDHKMHKELTEEKNTITPKYMRAKELASYLSIGLSTVWAMAKAKRITPLKASERVTVFNVADVEKALFGEVA